MISEVQIPISPTFLRSLGFINHGCPNDGCWWELEMLSAEHGVIVRLRKVDTPRCETWDCWFDGRAISQLTNQSELLLLIAVLASE
ncbi:hypothetical protein [Rubinisphaera margarita]|uniref:hypothetical protein n=1 Tax=Rubinisphaera margarita TaxID=2909586 RepID=UPI001EE96129|nr:hypothetical protein [Rubinisphaera margarita]